MAVKTRSGDWQASRPPSWNAQPQIPGTRISIDAIPHKRWGKRCRLQYLNTVCLLVVLGGAMAMLASVVPNGIQPGFLAALTVVTVFLLYYGRTRWKPRLRGDVFDVIAQDVWQSVRRRNLRVMRIIIFLLAWVTHSPSSPRGSRRQCQRLVPSCGIMGTGNSSGCIR